LAKWKTQNARQLEGIGIKEGINWSGGRRFARVWIILRVRFRRLVFGDWRRFTLDFSGDISS